VDEWLIWLIAALAAFAGEVATLGFFLAPFGAGALGGMAVALAGGSTGAAFVVFAVVTAGCLAAVRPVARRHLTQPPSTRTGTAALVGRTGTVLEPVGDDRGTVKVEGEVWTARPYIEGETIEAGTRVHVIEIHGATALVSE
jgi:membrane protein implicated in regulation of membrane protease activity